MKRSNALLVYVYALTDQLRVYRPFHRVQNGFFAKEIVRFISAEFQRRG